MKKNLLKTIIIVVFLIFLILPISAEDANIIIVNGSQTIVNYSGGTNINSDTYKVDDSYWATDIKDYTDHYLIKEKSKKMVNDLFLKLNSENPFILIGFSQGGLRVRSMAQYIAHNKPEAKLKGIITIDSPNMGGPLAKKNIATGLLFKLGSTFIETLNVIPATNEFAQLLNLVLLSSDQQDPYEKSFTNLEKYIKDNLPTEIISREKDIKDNLNNINDEKGILTYAPNVALDLLKKVLVENIKDTDVAWFLEILSGAMESSSASHNIKEITSEFRPGSQYLEDLNKQENIKLEKKYKRVALIGMNGDIYNVDQVKNVYDKVISTHKTLYASYISKASYYLNKWKFIDAAFWFYMSIKVNNSISRWNKIPDIWSFYATASNDTDDEGNPYYEKNYKATTSNRGRNSHDLLVPVESQKMPEEEEKYQLVMEYINHIFPSAGPNFLILDLRKLAERQFKDSLLKAKILLFNQ